MREIVSNTAVPHSPVLAHEVVPQAPRVYGAQHRNYNGEDNKKRYFVHNEPNGTWVMHSLTSPTGHLNESGIMRSLYDVAAYCAEHGHTLYEFTDQQEFARWLLGDM